MLYNLTSLRQINQGEIIDIMHDGCEDYIPIFAMPIFYNAHSQDRKLLSMLNIHVKPVLVIQVWLNSQGEQLNATAFFQYKILKKKDAKYPSLFRLHFQKLHTAGLPMLNKLIVQ